MEQRHRENYRMSYIKDTMINTTMDMMRGNLNHTFFAITIRPYENFIKRYARFPTNTRHLVGEAITSNLIAKYNSHLISQPNKTKNFHLRIIHHDAIEEKHKNGSYDIPHSHGVWGIHNSLLDKWNDEKFHDRIKEFGSFQYKHKSYPLSNVIHSFDYQDISNPEDWLSYAYKWCDDEDASSCWGFIHSNGVEHNAVS